MALPRKVTVIGAGDIGCGWAALCVAAGWPGTLFDASAQGLERGAADVPQRARALVQQQRASQGIVERGLLEFEDRKSTRLNSSHSQISYAVFCLEKKS